MPFYQLANHQEFKFGGVNFYKKQKHQCSLRIHSGDKLTGIPAVANRRYCPAFLRYKYKEKGFKY